MRRRNLRTAPGRCVWLLAGLLLAPGIGPEAARAQNSDRDVWQRVPDVMAALAIGTGSRVADVGAGNGYFISHLAREVGAGGRVFAVEISESALSRLGRLAANDGFENIEVVLGETDDPRLSAKSLDAVLVVDAYHEMIEYEAMLAGMYSALKVGGRLVILDLVPSDVSTSRDNQVDRHRIGIDLVEQELRTAGFEVLDSDPQFTKTGRGRGQWMLTARRPAGDAP